MHRDLKPLNIFLTKDKIAKLGDFGEARKLEDIEAEDKAYERQCVAEGAVVVRDIVGSPYYIAPELWQFKCNSKASDIWAIGIILFEITA